MTVGSPINLNQTLPNMELTDPSGPVRKGHDVSKDPAPVVTSSSGLRDVELLQRFEEHHDQQAMSDLITRHGPLVMGVCRRILKNDHDAADAYQATFLVLLKKASSLGTLDSLACWLYGVAHCVANKSRTQLSRRQKREGSEIVATPTAPAIEPVDEEMVNLIRAEVANLPEKYRLPLILCCLEGTAREVAAQHLGWSLGSLKGRLERGRDMLLARLKRHGIVLSTGVLTSLLAHQAVAEVPAALAGSTVHALALAASGQTLMGGTVSAQTVALTQGVLKAMFLTKLKITVGLLLAGGIATIGSVMALQQLRAAPGGEPVAVEQVPAKDQAGRLDIAQNRSQPAEENTAAELATKEWKGLADEQVDAITIRNLRAIIYAMHAYVEDHKGELPPSAVPNPDLPAGKRLSGFVLLLPYMGIRPSYLAEDNEAWKEWHADNGAARRLFSKIDLKKAWDDPANAEASKTIVLEFLTPGEAPIRDSRGLAVSHFAFVRGSGSLDNGMFPRTGKTELSIPDIVDGTIQTLAVGQVFATPGPWIAEGASTTRFLEHPSIQQKDGGFGSSHPGAAYFAVGDGSIFFLDMSASKPAALHEFAGRADGKMVSIDDISHFPTATQWKKARVKAGNKK